MNRNQDTNRTYADLLREGAERGFPDKEAMRKRILAYAQHEPTGSAAGPSNSNGGNSGDRMRPHRKPPAWKRIVAITATLAAVVALVFIASRLLNPAPTPGTDPTPPPVASDTSEESTDPTPMPSTEQSTTTEPDPAWAELTGVLLSDHEFFALTGAVTGPLSFSPHAETELPELVHGAHYRLEYTGEVDESFPPQIRATGLTRLDDPDELWVAEIPMDEGLHYMGFYTRTVLVDTRSDDDYLVGYIPAHESVVETDETPKTALLPLVELEAGTADLATVLEEANPLDLPAAELIVLVYGETAEDALEAARLIKGEGIPVVMSLGAYDDYDGAVVVEGFPITMDLVYIGELSDASVPFQAWSLGGEYEGPVMRVGAIDAYDVTPVYGDVLRVDYGGMILQANPPQLSVRSVERIGTAQDGHPLVSSYEPALFTVGHEAYNAQLIDVREQADYTAGHILSEGLHGTLNWPLSSLRTGRPSSESNRSMYFVYGESEQAAQEAVELLNSYGYELVFNLGAVDAERINSGPNATPQLPNLHKLLYLGGRVAGFSEHVAWVLEGSFTGPLTAVFGWDRLGIVPQPGEYYQVDLGSLESETPPRSVTLRDAEHIGTESHANLLRTSETIAEEILANPDGAIKVDLRDNENLTDVIASLTAGDHYVFLFGETWHQAHVAQKQFKDAGFTQVFSVAPDDGRAHAPYAADYTSPRELINYVSDDPDRHQGSPVSNVLFEVVPGSVTPTSLQIERLNLSFHDLVIFEYYELQRAGFHSWETVHVLRDEADTAKPILPDAALFEGTDLEAEPEIIEYTWSDPLPPGHYRLVKRAAGGSENLHVIPPHDLMMAAEFEILD